MRASYPLIIHGNIPHRVRHPASQGTPRKSASYFQETGDENRIPFGRNPQPKTSAPQKKRLLNGRPARTVTDA
jgi:hypothetical protein